MTPHAGLKGALTGTIGIVCGLVFLAVATVHALRSDTGAGGRLLMIAGGAILCAGFVAGGIWVIRYGRAVSHWERRRTEALSSRTRDGTQRRAVAPVPQTDADTSAPLRPLVVDIRVDPLRLLAYVAVGALTIAAAIEATTLMRTGSIYAVLRDVQLLAVGTGAVLAPGAYFLLLLILRERLVVDADGVHVATGFGERVQSIAWADMRLFALCPPGKHGMPAICYELGNERDSVRWTHVPRRRPLNLLTLAAVCRPHLATDRYEQQTQLVIATIESKTGLRLLDLRDA